MAETDWLTDRLQRLEQATSSQDWAPVHELRRRARRRRTRRRVAIGTITATVAGAGVILPLVFVGLRGPGPGARGDFVVLAHSGSAVELAAKAAGPAPNVSQRAVSQLARDETGFSISLLRRLSQASPGTNVVTSPSSLATALAMLELGARGSTAEQISRALGTAGLTSSQQAADWQALSADQQRLARRTGVDLEVANGIWTQRGLPMSPAFMSAMRRYFDAGVWQADFATDPQAATSALNAWVSSHTHRKITELFGPGSVGPGTQVILANASYLKARWAQQFVPSLTAQGSFHLGTGGTTSVPFMHVDQSIRVPALARAGIDAVQLPYQGGRFAALVLMPTSGTLQSFLQTLTPAVLSRDTRHLTTTSVNLSLPRVNVHTGHVLNSVLQSLGIRDAFGSADLTGMSSSRGLAVQQVEQRAFLSVTEQGTEAAAATGIMIGTAARPARLAMTINRPFLFLIRDTVTGGILFASVIENPSASS